jgi:phospholipase C
MKRRDVLKSMGAVAGAAGITRLLPGCGEGESGPGEIKHVVLVMMENRSYDHVLGARAMLEGKPGDGITASMTNLDAGGAPVALFAPTPQEMCVPDPPHSWGGSHAQWNAGACDGFLTTHQNGAPGDLAPMQYLSREHQPVTWALADEYATCDAWFCSVMGPTWPNRMYWMAGTSMGMQGNDLPEGGFTAPTIYDRLEAAGVDWRIYYGDLPFVPLLGAQVQVDFTDHLWRMEDFFNDCANGTLPPVSYIDPPFTIADDHPPHHPMLGQEFIASVYAALASSPHWESTLLVITYDEHGGFFDHVSPPTVTDDRAAEGFDQLGFRVPTLVVGPYVKKGHVSSVVRDHTSALKHLEGMFGLEPLTTRTSAAEDLSELIDAEALAAGDAREPIELPSLDLDAWMTELPACGGAGSGREAPHHDILEQSDAHPEWTARWDRRDQAHTLRGLFRAQIARYRAR